MKKQPDKNAKADAEDATKRGDASSASPAAAGYPARLKHGMANPGQVYQRVDDQHARLPASRGKPRLDDMTSLQLADGPAQGPQARVIYRDPASGQVVVPSGRVLVRFADGVNAQDRAPALHAAGYRITQVLSYAPQAAWVESLSQDSGAALGGLQALEALADVKNVEPQWLSPRATKQD